MAGREKLLVEEMETLEKENQAILDATEARDRQLAIDGKKSAGPTDEEKTVHTENADRIKAIKTELSMRQRQLETGEGLTPVSRPGEQPATADDDVEPWRKTKIPARARRYMPLRNFDGEGAAEQAYRFGLFCAAGCGNSWASGRCRELGLTIDAAAPHSEGVNEFGGVTVPEEFDPAMIFLLEQHGVFRRSARRSRMRSDTKRRLRRVSGLTATFVAEGAAGTHSKKKWDWVTLTAKDLMVLTTMTADLAEDSIVNLGDDLAGEIAIAFAEKEDDCGFNGTGQAAFGGIVGVNTKIKGLSGTIANIAGLIVADGNLYSEITLLNFQEVVGILPTFADNNRARWYVHKVFWATVMYKLQLAAGGTTPGDIADFRRPTFLGYPVEFTQKQPKTEANSQVCALLGDLTQAADFGDRSGGRAVAFSRDATIDSVNMFEANQIGVRGFERFDINVHDVGNASGTASLRVPGPIVGLITAAS